MIKISVSGLDETIKHLEQVKKSLEIKQHRLMERLAEIGIDVASVRFKTAQYDGINDVSVDKSPEWIDEHTLAIVARGQAVAFIEFGTGVHYAEKHPTASKVGAVRGSYGQGKGKRDSWTYYGEPGTNGRVVRTIQKEGEEAVDVIRTHGNPPARAMYDAGKAMRERIVDIAREVYKE